MTLPVRLTCYDKDDRECPDGDIIRLLWALKRIKHDVDSLVNDTYTNPKCRGFIPIKVPLEYAKVFENIVKYSTDAYSVTNSVEEVKFKRGAEWLYVIFVKVARWLTTLVT